MFFKKIEFITLHSFSTKTIFRFQITSVAHAIAVVVGLISLMTMSGIFLRGALFGLAFFFSSYWVFSIFVYLYKKGQYGVFTRIIQRFWKRTLWLFWLIELFLFCIYLFLLLISPQETAYILDNFQLVCDSSTHLKVFFTTALNVLVIILLYNTQLLLHKYNTMRQLLNAMIALLLLKAVIEDFLQFFAVNSFYTGYAWNHTHLKMFGENRHIYKTNELGVWEQEAVELKTRTAAHYIYLLIFLKLWHTVFIFLVFVFLDNVSNRGHGGSYNSLAANLQNFYFLMFFNYILKITVLKQYLSYLGTFVFYWFFVNQNAYDVTYFYHLFDLRYLIFAWSDLT